VLTQLTLENFKKHKSLGVNFTEGLNLITGPNYTGKSTILQAIRYAFEGATAIPGGKATSTLHGETDHKVELEFVANGRDYVVTRTLKKATLKRDGETIAKSASAVTTHLAELLGMTGQRFGQLRYGKQKETEALLTLGVTELHKIVGEVSQVEVINTVISKCGTAVSECTGGLDALPVVDTHDLENNIKKLQNTIEHSYARLQSIVSDIDSNNAALVDMKESLARATQLAQAAHAANEERRRLDQEGEKLVRDIDASKVEVANLAGADERFQAIQSGLQEVMDEVNTLSRGAATLAAKEREYDTMLQRRDAAVADEKKYLALLEDRDPAYDIAPLEAALQSAYQDKAEVEKEVRDLKAALASGVCPTCKRPYDHGPEWLSECEDKLAAAEADCVRLNRAYRLASNNLTAAQTYNESLRKTSDRASAAALTSAALAKDLDKLQGELEELSLGDPASQLKEAEERAAKYRAELGPANVDAMALTSVRTELEGLTRRFEEVTARRHGLGPEETAASTDKLSREVTDLEAEITRLTSSVYQPASTEYTRMTGELSVMQRDLAVSKETAAKRSQLESRLGTAKALNKYLRGNRDRFMGKVWDGIMGRASAFSSACTGGDIQQVSRGENGKFTFIEGGHELPVEAASGAQRSIMGLGLQLALAELLPCPLQTILLDEPSSDADEEVSLAMSTVLSANHSQLLVISHRTLDGAVANNTIDLER
jgi:DNA repair exonuclease SbcCD ATPase subunit